MWDFSAGRSLAAMARTWPFIVLRMAVFFAITFAYLVVVGAGTGVGWGVGALGDADFQSSAAFWGGFAGFGLASGILYLAREYILYLVKAGHIAVLAEILSDNPIPAGKTQIAYATETVKTRFVEANLLFVLDQLIKGVLRIITGAINTLAVVLPVPGLDTLARIASAVIRLSITYVDEIILAHNIRARSANPWESSKEELILYAQNAGTMVKNAVWLTVFIYALAFALFLVMLAPAAALVVLVPGGGSGFTFVVAILFAWSLKAALLEPFAIASLMQVYFKVTEGQTPDPEWEARLDAASDKFRELKERAARWVPQTSRAGAQ